MDDDSDESLMARLGRDRPELLEVLLRRYATPLPTFILRMVGDPHRGEELFQEVFLAVWLKRRQYRYPRPFKPWLVVTAQTPAGPESISRSVRLTRSWKLMLTSDKPIYQPGQTIHVRALALRQPDLRPVAEQETILTLTDPKGNILFKQAEHTSRYGIAAVDCVLAKEIAEGAYTLACKIGDSESRQRVEIRPYVLPKFKVEVRPDRSFYQPKETVHLVVQADYFFGKPVAGAAVDLEIREGAKERQRLSGHTDEKGTATFEYALSDDEAKDGDKPLSFLAHVADSAGQKQSGGVERLVTRRPVRIEVLPENGKLVRGVRNVVYLLATRADGTPVRTRLTIEGLNEVVGTDAIGTSIVRDAVPISI